MGFWLHNTAVQVVGWTSGFDIGTPGHWNGSHELDTMLSLLETKEIKVELSKFIDEIMFLTLILVAVNKW